MRTPSALLSLLALALLAASAFAASPSLQITNYTTTPDSVYAGTMGYLQVTLANNGDATASGVSAYYTVDGVTQTTTLGDLGSSTSTKVVVPFKASSSSAGGIQVVSVDFYYSDSSTNTNGQTTSSNSKKVSLQVPITISQVNPLRVSTLSTDTPSIVPGDDVVVKLKLTNTGGLVNNLFITLPSNSSFSLGGVSQQEIGTLAANTSQDVSVTLMSSSSATVGTYTVPLVFTYYDRLSRPTNVTVGVGPITVQEASNEYRLEVSTPKTIEVGDQVNMTLTLRNMGDQPISALVEPNTTSVFTPLGLQRVYFDSVGAGQSATKTITIGVDSSASAGYYVLPIHFTPSIGDATTQQVGVQVVATPSVSVTLDTSSSSSTSILVANTGNSQIHSVSATATSGSASTTSFIGTLNVDDYATMTLSSSTGDSVQVVVTFKDSTNVQHSVTQQVSLSTGVVSATAGGSTSTQSRGAANRSSGFTGGPGGMGGPNGGLFGISSSGSSLPLIPIGIGLVVLVVAFLFYRNHQKKKEKAAREEAARKLLENDSAHAIEPLNHSEKTRSARSGKSE